MDQRFHRLLHLGALWRHDLAVKAGDRAGRHVAQTLFDDLCRLIDFLDADHEAVVAIAAGADRSEEHTSELQSLMRISYAVFCLKKKNKQFTYIVYDYNMTQYCDIPAQLYS